MSYYVKLDNIITADESKRGYQRFEATSGPELLQQACTFFGWNHRDNVTLQLWTVVDGRKIRVDTLDTLEESYQFVQLKAFPTFSKW